MSELISSSCVDRPQTTLLLVSHTPSVHAHTHTHTKCSVLLHSMRFALTNFVCVGSYLWSGVWQPHPFSNHLLTFLFHLSISLISWQLHFFFSFLFSIFFSISFEGPHFTFSCIKTPKVICDNQFSSRFPVFSMLL